MINELLTNKQFHEEIKTSNILKNYCFLCTQIRNKNFTSELARKNYKVDKVNFFFLKILNLH